MNPVNAAKLAHNTCFVVLRKILLAVQGALSSLICCERLPSVRRSIHTKISVQTVCGQANPHHRQGN